MASPVNGLSQTLKLNINKSTTISVSGNPGYRVLFSITAAKNTSTGFGIMETWTVVGKKFYFISYIAPSSKFMKYLPEANKMISSIGILKS
jgi:hypothetical protein